MRELSLRRRKPLHRGLSSHSFLQLFRGQERLSSFSIILDHSVLFGTDYWPRLIEGCCLIEVQLFNEAFRGVYFLSGIREKKTLRQISSPNLKVSNTVVYIV